MSSNRDIPKCEKCGQPCVKRQNRSGGEFFGCRNFPRCRGRCVYPPLEEGFVRASWNGRCKICKNAVHVGDAVQVKTWIHKECVSLAKKKESAQNKGKKGLNKEKAPIVIPDKFNPNSDKYIPPTNQSTNIRNSYINERSNLIIDAKAGCGKTTLLEWLICTTVDKERAPDYLPKPSWDQQEVIFLAFNKNIKAELQERVGNKLPGVSVGTLNGYGHRLLGRHYNMRRDNSTLDDNKVKKISKELFPYTGKKSLKLSDDEKKRNQGIAIALEKTVDKVKNMIAPPSEYMNIVKKFKIPLNFEEEYLNLFLRSIDEVLKRDILLVRNAKIFDFNDQIWIPSLLVGSSFWEPQSYKPEYLEFAPLIQPYPKDVVFIDETQDLNRAQVILSLMAAGLRYNKKTGVVKTKGRIIAVGDPKQSIYAFRSADSKSMDKIYATLNETVKKCQKKGLSVCWRCPESVIEIAQDILKLPFEETIQAAPHAPKGKIKLIQTEDITHHITKKDGVKTLSGHTRTMILSRRNAPLITTAFNLISKKIPAIIRGRDIFKDIISFIEFHNPKNNTKVSELQKALEEFYLEEIDRIIDLDNLSKEEAVSELSPLLDKIEVVRAMLDFPEVRKSNEIKVLVKTLNSLFKVASCRVCSYETEEERCPRCPNSPKIPEMEGVLLSTVHKSKGLEALRIFLIDLPCITGNPPWVSHLPEDSEEVQQERNLYYVAATRCKFISDDNEQNGELYYCLDEDEKNIPDLPFTTEEIYQVMRGKRCVDKGLSNEEKEELQSKNHESFEENKEVQETFDFQEKVEQNKEYEDLIPIEEIGEIMLPEMPSSGDGSYAGDPTKEDWLKIRNLYLEFGIPAMLTTFKGWNQYALVVNGVVATTTTVSFNYGGRGKGQNSIKVIALNEDGQYKGRKGRRVFRTEGWQGRVIERINQTLLSTPATKGHEISYNNMKEIY